MEFEYLSDVPVLTIDVNEDFKGNKTKSADMIEKVSDFNHINIFKMTLYWGFCPFFTARINYLNLIYLQKYEIPSPVAQTDCGTFFKTFKNCALTMILWE